MKAKKLSFNPDDRDLSQETGGVVATEIVTINGRTVVFRRDAEPPTVACLRKYLPPEFAENEIIKIDDNQIFAVKDTDPLTPNAMYKAFAQKPQAVFSRKNNPLSSANFPPRYAY